MLFEFDCDVLRLAVKKLRLKNSFENFEFWKKKLCVKFTLGDQEGADKNVKSYEF